MCVAVLDSEPEKEGGGTSGKSFGGVLSRSDRGSLASGFFSGLVDCAFDDTAAFGTGLGDFGRGFRSFATGTWFGPLLPFFSLPYGRYFDTSFAGFFDLGSSALTLRRLVSVFGFSESTSATGAAFRFFSGLCATTCGNFQPCTANIRFVAEPDRVGRLKDKESKLRPLINLAEIPMECRESVG